MSKSKRYVGLPELVRLLNNPIVSRPKAVHAPGCSHGAFAAECTCPARETDARLRAALLAVGVVLAESPKEQHERESIALTQTMCRNPIQRVNGAWGCPACGWRLR